MASSTSNSPISIGETIDTGPLPHPAMDYAGLRSEGLRLLGELAGSQWSDFNSHDPGVTILEQVCYAITDLAYRINYSVPDLLAGGGYDAHASLPSAATVLRCEPVTTLDLRKLAMDAGAGSNAWVEAGKAECAFFHHETSEELHLRPDPTAVEDGAVPMVGLHRVWLPTGEVSSERTRSDATARIHGARGMCEDVAVEILRRQPIWIDASIEVSSGRSAQQILDSIVANIESYFAPCLDFETLAQAQERCANHGEGLFEGPALERGFLCERTMVIRERRLELYASDLIRTISDVPEVRAVRRLTISTSARGAGERWAASVAEDAIPTLAPTSSLTLLRDGLPLPLDADAINQGLERQRRRSADPVLPASERDLAVTAGRDRDLARYHSVLEHFPTTYGVGRFGLPPSASPQRKGQAKQLQAYVLLFDQLLANGFAQLAHARELFSHFGETPQTYFGQVVADEVIDLDRLRAGTPEKHAAWLGEAVVSTAADELASLERRARFLGHLLARYAEQLDEVDTGQEGQAEERTLEDIRRKLAFLRHYPRLSARRGSGCDVFDASSVSGLIDRLRLELGLPEDGDSTVAFIAVEHPLLRPVVEDRAQLGTEGEELVPLLAGVERSDPYSLQLTVALAGRAGRSAETYERLVEGLLIEHAPAHIEVTALWLRDEGKKKDWSNFRRDHRAWREALAIYRRLRLQGQTADSKAAQLVQLGVRDSRDRVIEHLGLGGTYPLRDLPVPELLIIPADTATRIPLEYSQAGVIYRLCDGRTGEAIKDGNKFFQVTGTGAAVSLPTPVVVEDVRYKIQAIKPAGIYGGLGVRAAWLHTEVTVKEGVDTSLDAAIQASILDKRIDNAKSTDARLVQWGTQPKVEVYLSQEGVLYTLVDHADNDRVLSAEEVLGTAETIALETIAMREDVDLRVMARKPLEAGESDASAREGLLDIVLPLRVMANPNVIVEMSADVVGYGGAARVRVLGSQRSAKYRVYHRDTHDEAYYFGDPAGLNSSGGIDQAITVAAGDERSVYVLRPSYEPWWRNLPRFTDLGEVQQGDGKTLSFTDAALTHGQTYLVRANKTHQLGRLDQPSEGTWNTSVQQKRAVAVLVRPNTKPELLLRVIGEETRTVAIVGGEAGVFYELVKTAGKAVVAQAGYVHQRDEDDASFNKGVAQLRVGGDLVIAPDQTLALGETRDRDPALAPVLELSAEPTGTRWKIVARRATTALSAELEGRARVLAMPELSVAGTEAGGEASVTFTSAQGQRYQLLSADGEPLGDAVDGTGKLLELSSGAIDVTTSAWMSVRPVAEDPIVVERRVALTFQINEGS